MTNNGASNIINKKLEFTLDDRMQMQLAAYLYTKTTIPDVKKRKQSTDYVMAQIKQSIIDHFDLFVKAAESYLLSKDIPYNSFLAMISDPAVTKEKLKHSENLILFGLGKMFLWYVVYAQILGDLQGKKAARDINKLQKKLVNLISLDLFPATHCLINRFFSKKLQFNYYSCYEFLHEECIRLEEIGPLYQQNILTDLTFANQNISKLDPKSLELGQVAIAKVFTVLLTYQQVIKFLYFFGEDYTKLLNQGSLFCTKLQKMCSEMDALKFDVSDIATITQMESHFDELKEKSQNKHAYVMIFKAIKLFYITEWQQKVSVSKDFNLPEFSKNLEELIITLQNHESDDLEKIVTINRVLAVLSHFKSMPVEDCSNVTLRVLELLRLTLVYVDFKNNAVESIESVIHTTRAILKQIANNVLYNSGLDLFDFRKEKSNSLEEDLIKQLSSLKIADEEIYQKNAQEHENAKRSCEVANEKELKKYSQKYNEWTNKLIQQTKNNEKELATLKEKHGARCNVLCNQIKNKEKQYNTIKSESEKKISQLKVQQQNEIASLKEEHYNLCQKFNEEALAQEKGSLADSHHETIAKLKKQNSDEIKDLQIKFQKKIKDQEDVDREEIKQLIDRLKNVKTSASNGIEKSYNNRLSKMKDIQLNTLEKIKLQSLPKQQKPDNATLTMLPPPIATISVPDEIEIKLQIFEYHGIEYFIFGGYVRDKLRGLSDDDINDIDVMVNCSPEQLQQSPIKLTKFIKPTLRPDVFKFFGFDLVCRTWSNLPDLSNELQKLDFKFNTFICQNNRVYDLLGFYKSIHVPYIKLINPDPHECFKKDPVVILRLIQFSIKLNKEILSSDYDAIIKCKESISQLPIGIYSNNLKKLFVNYAAPKYYQKIKDLRLLAIIIPTLDDYENCLFSLKALEPFWVNKMNEFANNPDNYDGYYVLALFLLMPYLLNNHNIESVIAKFLAKFIGLNQFDQEIVRRSISNSIKGNSDALGLHQEYMYFEQKFHKPKNYTPAYRSRNNISVSISVHGSNDTEERTFKLNTRPPQRYNPLF